MKSKIIILFIILTACSNLFAQLKFGTDLYTRYIWRGINLGGDAPSFQPSISYTAYGATIGFWGAYSFPGDVNYAENDLFLSYSLATESAGTFSAIFTDYYFPNAPVHFGHFEDGGAHILEGGVSYSGPAVFPISLSGFVNFHNDPDNSVYLQIGYTFPIGEATLTPAVGLAPDKSVYYGTEKAAVINVSITAAKSIPITDKFAIPINVSYINNPNLDVSNLVFGLGFTF